MEGVVMSKKVLIAGIKHETNTFASKKTDLESYKARSWLMGPQIISAFTGVKNEYGGMIDAADEFGFELVPVVAADAQPGGLVTRNAFDLAKKSIIMALTRSEYDGILLVLHGAMVVEDEHDGEGELLHSIRNLDKHIPIIATLDMHCNFTKRMFDNATAFFGYDTYPHVDMYERGLEAGRLMGRLLSAECRPTMAYRQIPMISPGIPTAAQPMQDLMDLVGRLEAQPDVLGISYMQGFRMADTPDTGMSVLAITDANMPLAESIAERLANATLARKTEFKRIPVELTQAVSRAIAAEQYPVVLADISDNPGSGAPCDGTQLLAELLRQGAEDVVFAKIYDPESVQRAVQAGVGNMVELELGGKTESTGMHGEPLRVSGRVRTLKDGVFKNTGPMSRGLVVDAGQLAVVDIEGIAVLISSIRVQPYDAEIIRHVGIKPEKKKIVVVKSLVHFRASYGEFAKEIIEVDLPGLAAINVMSIPYVNIRRPIYPLN